MRVGRFSGQDKPGGNLRIFRHEPPYDRNSRVVLPPYREQKFEGRVVLLEEATQVVFEALVQAGKRFENADCRRCTALAMLRRPRMSERRCNRKDAVNPTAHQHS